MRKTCKRCGKTLVNKQKKFCSSVCSSANKGDNCRLPIGTESIQKRSDSRSTHVYVVVGRRANGKPKYKRKAVKMMEDVLGREMTKAEQYALEFLDGNTLNVTLENLYLPKLMEIRKCKICGVDIVVKRNEIEKGYGIYCSHRCVGISQKKVVKRQCLWCGKKIELLPNQVKEKNRGIACCHSHATLIVRKRQREERLFANRKPNPAQEE